MPPTQKIKYETLGVESTRMRPMNRATAIARNSLGQRIDGNAALIECDVVATKENARISSIIPTIAQDDASRLAQSGQVRSDQAQTQNSENDLSGNGHPDGSLARSIALSTFEVAKPRAQKTKSVTQRRAREAHVLMRLVDRGEVRIERLLADEAFSAEVREIQEHGPRSSR